MPKHINGDTWKEKSSDIAYKNPFSDITNRTRKQLFFISTIVILNSLYPIDLSQSHIIGISFVEGKTPPLDGLLGLLLIYIFISWSIYNYQEINSWLAQANEVRFEEYRGTIQNIYSHHATLNQYIENAGVQLERYNDSFSKINENIDLYKDNQIFNENINNIDSYAQSFMNTYQNLETASEKYINEIDDASAYLKTSDRNYRSAMFTQIVRTLLLDMVFPFLLGAISIVISVGAVVKVIKGL